MWKLRLSVLAACGALGLTGAAGALADPGGQPNSNANPNAGGSSNSSASSNAGGNASSNAGGNASGNASSHGNSNAGGKSSSHKNSQAGGNSKSQGKSGHSGPGDSNAGDVWLDNVGQPAGPGHEMDPHLACQDINLWGDKLADSSGTYTINGWPPSGSKEVDYSSTWSYDTSKGGDQVVSVINIQQLIATAAANGDTPAKQGYHFKLDFSQDPQKHKVFWVNCPPPSSPSGTSQSSSSSSTSSSPSSTSQSTAPSSTSSSAPSGSVKPAHHRRHRHSVKARHLRRPHRRHHVRRSSVKAVSVAAPAFTG